MKLEWIKGFVLAGFGLALILMGLVAYGLVRKPGVVNEPWTLTAEPQGDEVAIAYGTIGEGTGEQLYVVFRVPANGPDAQAARLLFIDPRTGRITGEVRLPRTALTN